MKFTVAISVGILAVIFAALFTSSTEVLQDSIAIEFSTHVENESSRGSSSGENRLVAGKETLLTFRLTNNKTGQPITGLEPEVSFYTAGEHDYAREHEHFDGHHLTRKLNMAKVQLFVLNSGRGTVEVLDTFGSYDPRSNAIKNMGTMTSKVIMLKNTGSRTGDITADRYGDHIYVTLPDDDLVVVVNTINREVVKYIDAGSNPDLMFLQPGSRYLWVSSDGSFSIIDTVNNAPAGTVWTGKGYHQVAFSPDHAYITNTQYNTVSVIRLEDLTKVKDIKVQRMPYGIDYSSSSKEIYVANSQEGTLTVIDAQTNSVKRLIPLSAGIETVRFSQDGRRGVVLNKYENSAYVIDADAGKMIKVVKTGEVPGAVEFMGEYALVRNAYSNDVTYINTEDPDISNNEIVGTQPPLNVTPRSLQVTSYGDEAVIASPRDGRVYFMHEMSGQPMAMSSATVEYGSDSVAVVENKIHETSPGVYRQYVVLEREGLYALEFSTAEINATFRIEVLPDAAAGQMEITPLFKNKTFVKGDISTVRYLITDGRTGAPVENITDLTYIAIKPATGKGIWTERYPARHAGNGTYEAEVVFPEDGDYMISLISSTLNRAGYRTEYEYINVRNASSAR